MIGLSGRKWAAAAVELYVVLAFTGCGLADALNMGVARARAPVTVTVTTTAATVVVTQTQTQTVHLTRTDCAAPLPSLPAGGPVGAGDPVSIRGTYNFLAPSAAGLEFSPVFTGYASKADSALKSQLVINGASDADPLGWLFTAKNVNGDLFMGLVKSWSAAPNTTYTANFTVSFLSNAPLTCPGIGAGPGDGVLIKVGATNVAPSVKYSAADGTFDFDNLHLGRQSSTAGTYGTAELTDCLDTTTYVPVTRSHVHPTPITTDTDGNLWLIVGTSSFFEGSTAIYWQQISAELIPV